MSAKDIIIKPIDKPTADKIVKKYHYSGKAAVSNNLNFGVYYKGLLLGCMEFGVPMNKHAMMPLFKNAKWNEVIELNRMAFSDALPRFAESRALSIAFKWMKKNTEYKYIISFADGCQCGHGTIYQASNFKLTQIKENNSIIKLPNGDTVAKIVFGIKGGKYSNQKLKSGITSLSKFLDIYYKGYETVKGYQYRYVYFINNDYENFTGEFIPFSKIKELDIEMYKGEWVKDGANK